MVIRHILPVPECVYCGIFQYLSGYSDNGIRPFFHHAFYHRGFIVKGTAQVLQAEHIAQGPEKTAPPVGPAESRMLFAVSGFQGLLPAGLYIGSSRNAMQFSRGNLLPPFFRKSFLRVKRQPFGGKLFKFLRLFHGKPDKLGHARVGMLLELAHHYPFMVYIELGFPVFLKNPVFKFRNGSVPGVDPQKFVQPKPFRQAFPVPPEFRSVISLCAPYSACLRPDESKCPHPRNINLPELQGLQKPFP